MLPGKLNRFSGHFASQLEVSDEAAGKGDAADEHGDHDDCDGELNRRCVGRWYSSAGEFGPTDEQARQSAESVEQRDEFGHACHLHTLGPDGANR